MKIKNKNSNNNVIIIAEIGNNHEGSIKLARKMIKMAKLSGADAVKFQTINPSKLIEEGDKKRIKQLKKFELSNLQFSSLKKYCDKLDIIFLSTPFDLEAVDVLNPLVPAFKISSGDNDYYELINKVLSKRKPIIVSTGLKNQKEIYKLQSYLKKNNKFKGRFRDNIAFLHCVSKYPTSLEEAYLENLNFLKKFDVTLGYSDHTLGYEACITSVIKGARIIEKHFTIDKNLSDFRDHKLSADPKEFKEMVRIIRNIEILLNKNSSLEFVRENLKNFRRSARYSNDISSGKKISINDLKWVRPGGGISNQEKDKIIGKILKSNVKKNQLIEMKHFK